MGRLKREHREFILRKIHSITGIIPIGGYLAFHLYENASALLGESAYNEMVAGIHEMPLLIFLEIFLIWLPILYHGIYGVVIMAQGKQNFHKYPQYFNNWMYSFQRWSGVITFAYLIYHFWGTWIQARFYGATVGYGMMQDIVNSPMHLSFYLIGVFAAVYHLANGVWTFSISWGITVGPRAQKIVHVICLLGGLALYIVAVTTLFAFKV